MTDDDLDARRQAAVDELLEWLTARADLFGPVDGSEDDEGERVEVVGPLICEGLVASLAWSDLGRPQAASWDRVFRSPAMSRSEARGRGLDIVDAFG